LTLILVQIALDNDNQMAKLRKLSTTDWTPKSVRDVLKNTGTLKYFQAFYDYSNEEMATAREAITT